MNGCDWWWGGRGIVRSFFLCAPIPLQSHFYILATVEYTKDSHGLIIDSESDRYATPKTNYSQAGPYVIPLGTSMREGIETLAVLHDRADETFCWRSFPRCSGTALQFERSRALNSLHAPLFTNSPSRFAHAVSLKVLGHQRY